MTDTPADPTNDKFNGDIEAFRSFYQWDASRATNFGFPDSVDVATEACKLGTPDPDQNAHPGAYLSGGPFVPPVVTPVPQVVTGENASAPLPVITAEQIPSLMLKVTPHPDAKPEHLSWLSKELTAIAAEFHRLFHSS